MAELPEIFKKPYQPSEHETDIYQRWEASGYFNPDKLVEDGIVEADAQPYSIVMPPPNANGSLHTGHAMMIAVEDLLMRFKRMCGYKTLWIPGADHAGFETQVVYEKKLEKEGRSRFQMTREELYTEIMDFTLHNKEYMENQIRALGSSCDWSRARFTLEEDIIKGVYDTFEQLYKDGLIYRGTRPVNWCTKHQTSLSQLETKDETRVDPLYYMKYGPFVLATVRPETKFGDTAVAVNPNDERYKEWIGKEIEFEGLNGPVKLAVIADEYVDPEFGTGVVKITPAHDPNDFEVGQRHGLEVRSVIDQYGKLTEAAGPYAGMKVAEARKKVAEDLEAKGLLERVDEKYEHTVLTCYKCGSVLEPRVMDQWFVKIRPLAQKAAEAVRNGETRFITEKFEKIFFHWMENAYDWNISRQIAWGIPIPAWFRGEEVHIGAEPPEGDGWERDPDTFDTWFSSGQWPFLTLGYPDEQDFKTYYPLSVMETGADILFFWISKMLMLGLYRTDATPFETVYLHGMVRDAKGQKMSKSKGNVVNPLDLTKKYGTDALRMALIVGNTPGTDLALSEDKIKGYKHFTNKLWNVARFVQMQLDDDFSYARQPALAGRDAKLIAEFESVAKSITDDMERSQLHIAAEKAYHYLWSTFADVIIEESKPILRDGDAGARASRQWALYHLLLEQLKLLHPFVPFVTETIWGYLPERNGHDMLMVNQWPTRSV